MYNKKVKVGESSGADSGGWQKEARDEGGDCLRQCFLRVFFIVLLIFNRLYVHKAEKSKDSKRYIQ